MLQNPQALLTFDKVHNSLRLPRETTSERPKWFEPLVFLKFWLQNVLGTTTACTFSTSQLPKVVQDWGVLYILTWKRASRHNGAHFFNIATSKSALKLRCFIQFDYLEMCFAPQRRALFRHCNFQQWTWCVFCAFWLGNLLRVATACNFSSLIWPAGSAPAALASLLSDPPEPQIIGNIGETRFATFLFARLDLLSSETFSFVIFFPLLSSSLTLPISAFHLSTLSEVWLLNFLRPVPLVPQRTSTTY